ncbi:hypothetical protein CKO25_08640 [Thiocapsa imhoffii]|uniref:Uncharacterized protein n=1 Tax=Thiocapsa imhoffii TaxID=382777 RepID=A0A9X0WHB7_9GAMM|nr:hypothetical protein [Thiocapsa imhoffii]
MHLSVTGGHSVLPSWAEPLETDDPGVTSSATLLCFVRTNELIVHHLTVASPTQPITVATFGAGDGEAAARTRRGSH